MPNGGLSYPTNREPHQTGEPWHPSCHGGKTPAKPHVSLHPCAPMARSLGSRGTAPCASHETFCRVAVCTGQPAGIHTRPASREACRRAAVKPRPSRMSPYAPARPWRAVRVQGHRPLRKPRDLLSSGGLYRPTSGKPHQTGEPWHPPCHGGKTPAKPHVSLHPCAPMARSPGSGVLPLKL